MTCSTISPRAKLQRRQPSSGRRQRDDHRPQKDPARPALTLPRRRRLLHWFLLTARRRGRLSGRPCRLAWRICVTQPFQHPIRQWRRRGLPSPAPEGIAPTPNAPSPLSSLIAPIAGAIQRVVPIPTRTCHGYASPSRASSSAPSASFRSASPVMRKSRHCESISAPSPS